MLSFIVYADIHYDHLGAGCVTLDDCVEVERALFERAAQGNFDFTLFCGDRFLRREPLDEVKTRADEVYQQAQFRQNYHLVGNHDWVRNSMKWHTANTLKRDCVVVMDAPGTYGAYNQRTDYAVHALPAGCKFDPSLYLPNSSALNVFAFHSALSGSYYDEEGRVRVEGPLSTADIDRPEFDIVFGGDIHVPQMFNLSNTKGGYVGSVIQRTMADADKARGWVEVRAEQVGGKWDFQIDFVPTRNFFTKRVFHVEDATTYENLGIPDEEVYDQYLLVELHGRKKNVDRLANDPKWRNYVEFCGVRHIELSRKYEVERSEVVVDMTSSSGLRDDLDLYLESGFADKGNLTRDQVMSALSTLMED